MDNIQIVINHKNQEFKYSIAEIMHKINIGKPFVVQKKQFDSPDELQEDLEKLKKQQNDPKQQIVYLSPELSLDSSFISNFKRGHRQYETIENFQKSFLFRSDNQELKTYNISTYVFSVKTLDDIKADKDEQNIILSKCNNELNNEADDEDIIMMFDNTNTALIYCYTNKDFEFLFNEKFVKQDEKEKEFISGNLIKKNNLYWYKLPNWFVYVETKSLRSVLKSRTNTIKLILNEIKNKDSNKYYTAENASRKDIFPNLEMESRFKIDNSYLDNPNFFQDEIGNVFYKKEYHRVNPETKLFYDWVHEIKTFKIPYDNQSELLLHSVNDKPCYQQFDKNGNKMKEEWRKDDVLHRVNNPAFIKYYKNGNKEQVKWYFLDELHREGDLPASSMYFKSPKGIIKPGMEEWFVHGKQIRKNDQPTSVVYYKSGNIQTERWMTTTFPGLESCYRENELPSSIMYYDSKDKQPKKESYINADLNDEDGYGYGLVVEYYLNGSVKSELWKFYCESSGYSSPHRSGDEPAYIQYYESNDGSFKGKIKSMEWFKRGRRFRSNKPDMLKFDVYGRIKKYYHNSENDELIHPRNKDISEGEIDYEDFKEEEGNEIERKQFQINSEEEKPIQINLEKDDLRDYKNLMDRNDKLEIVNDEKHLFDLPPLPDEEMEGNRFVDDNDPEIDFNNEDIGDDLIDFPNINEDEDENEIEEEIDL